MAQSTQQLELAPKPHRNHYLFSDYYLDRRVTMRDEWGNADVQTGFQEITQLWQQFTPQQDNEAQTEEAWIRPVLRALGHLFNVQVSLKTSMGTRRPDYVFFPDKDAQEAIKVRNTPLVESDLQNAIAVGDAKAWGLRLDQPVRTTQTVSANPGFQIDFYIRHSGLSWGILTNGRHWRLYHKESSKKLDVYYEVDLPELIESGDVERFKYFSLFFRRDAFLGKPSWLESVLEESRAYEQGVSDNLKEQVYEALRYLAEGFLKFPANQLRPTPETLKEIYDNSLIVLYRLLFILYAESRYLLPVHKNQAYTQSYSLHALKQRIVDELRQSKQLIASVQNIWNEFNQLCNIINNGNQELGVPAYDGGLFNPQRHLFPEHYCIGDLYLREAIDLLARTEDSATKTKEFVDYRDLEIRHLGSIYEGLLEYQLQYAEEPLAVHKKNGREVYVPVEKISTAPQVKAGEVYLVTDKGERKATGSYYTPDYIVQYIVEHTVGPILNELYKRHSQNKEALVSAILEVNVLDPAMGSGHFLVAATDFIARYLVSLELETVDGMGTEDELSYWRRRVVQSGIYGVDANPLAVELAKLSLWLNTVAKDKPLSFLDHHLRCGNSLIGTRVKDLMLTVIPKQSRRQEQKEKRAREAGQMSLLSDSAFAGSMSNAHYLLGQLDSLKSDTLEDVHQAERIYRKVADTVTLKARTLADVWTARYFGVELPEKHWRSLVDYLLHNGGEKFKYFDTLLEKARKIADEQRFFHWELEFPNVFFDKHGRLLEEKTGFDAVIGNPPWGASFTKVEKDFLKFTFHEIHQRTPESFNYFIYKAFSLINDFGILGFITPSSFLSQHEFERNRKNLVEQGFLRRICNLGDGVFQSVTAPPCILVISKMKKERQSLYYDLRHIDREALALELPKNAYGLDGSSILNNESYAFIVKKGRKILQKCYKHPSLKEIAEDVATGISTGLDKAFIYTEKEIENLSLERSLLKKLIIGGEITRYSLRPVSGKSVVYTTSQTDIDSYPNILKALSKHKERLSKRVETKSGRIPWYCLYRPRRQKLFEKPKILIRQTANRILAAFDSEEWYCLKSAIIVQLPDDSPLSYEYLLALLNSSLFDFLYKDLVSEETRIFPEVKPVQLFKLPIKVVDFSNSTDRQLYDSLVKLVYQMLTQNADLQTIDHKFSKLLDSDLGIEKPGKNLENWYELGWKEFEKNLPKQKVTLTLTQKSEWLDYFEQQKALALAIKQKIEQTDREIDQIVYKLYALTYNEVKIIDLDFAVSEQEYNA